MNAPSAEDMDGTVQRSDALGGKDGTYCTPLYCSALCIGQKEVHRASRNEEEAASTKNAH